MDDSTRYFVTIESPPLKINDPYVRDEIVEAMEESMPLIEKS